MVTPQQESGGACVAPSVDESGAEQAFQMRPKLDRQAAVSTIKQLIREVLDATLSGQQYSEEQSPVLCKSVSDQVQRRVYQLGVERYKFVTHTVMGEQRGSGVKVGAKCLWDTDTDKFVSDVFITDTMFCVVTVFLIYYY